MTTDKSEKEERKKVVIFLDSENNRLGALKLFKIGRYCAKNNWDVLSITNNYSMNNALPYKIFLNDFKQYKYIGEVKAIIIKDTYELPENLISCAIFGALEMLEIIEVYVLEYDSQTKDKSKRIQINPYSKVNDVNLMDQAVISLEHFKNKTS